MFWIWPPSNNSHHKDYEPFLGSVIPTIQPSFVTIASWGGHTQAILRPGSWTRGKNTVAFLGAIDLFLKDHHQKNPGFDEVNN